MENIEELYADDNDVNENNIYDFNFVNQPWDDRSKKSKTGIISLLAVIFVATMAIVINNLVIHYRYFDSSTKFNVEIDCNLVKVDTYRFAARLYSLSTNEMICLGVVLSERTILANGLCLRFGPIHILLANIVDPRCRKGFTVDVVDYIPHNGSVTQTLALMSIKENMQGCARAIKIGMSLNLHHDVNIIGRPNRGDKTLSLQLASIDKDNKTIHMIPEISSNLNREEVICVTGLAKCPVRVSDLLIQGNKLFGLASTSVHRREQMKTACFARISSVVQELKTLGLKIRTTT